MAVVGGEIWLPTKPGPTIPTPYIYQWDVVQGVSERWDEFVARAAAESTRWISGFGWDKRDVAHQNIEPFFNLVIVPASDDATISSE
jgi:hypothetical protein